MCGSLLGGSDTPEVQKIAPAPTSTSQENVSSTSAVKDAVDNARKKRGYAATRTSQSNDTISSGAGKTTLG